jgi:GNAT acetyltransferase-like protein
MMILPTARLLFREMTEADAEHLVRLGHNPNVTKYLSDPPPAAVEEALQVLKTVIFPQYANRIGRWAVIRSDTRAFIGWCGLKYHADVNEYDLGYRYFEEHWGPRVRDRGGASGLAVWHRATARRPHRGEGDGGKRSLTSRAGEDRACVRVVRRGTLRRGGGLLAHHARLMPATGGKILDPPPLTPGQRIPRCT